MSGFSLLIKPVSSDCNLRCGYCYYRKIKPNSVNRARMSDATLKRIIREYCRTDQPVYSMIWHGGEPTLMPRSFYEKAIRYQKTFAPKGARLANSLQTNGVGLTADLAGFIGRYRFLCGVSLDGPSGIHDQYRLTAGGRPTHHKVLEGIATLRAHGVAFNILTMVTRANVHRPLEVYRYLKKEYPFLQFIPCVEWDARGRPSPHSITGPEWGHFMVSVFDEWFSKDLHRISIRLFETILAKLVRGRALDCSSSASCDRYLLVEHNGDIYPCDFFVGEKYRLGNIRTDSLASLRHSEKYITFSSRKRELNNACRTCPFVDVCMGDCLKYRQGGRNMGENHSRLCEGWKIFFEGTMDRFQDLARNIIRRENLNRRVNHNVKEKADMQSNNAAMLNA